MYHHRFYPIEKPAQPKRIVIEKLCTFREPTEARCYRSRSGCPRPFSICDNDIERGSIPLRHREDAHHSSKTALDIRIASLHPRVHSDAKTHNEHILKTFRNFEQPCFGSEMTERGS